jgi:hypothetical protein
LYVQALEEPSGLLTQQPAAAAAADPSRGKPAPNASLADKKRFIHDK